MSTLSLLMLFSGIATIALIACYLDAKFQWRLHDWLNGRCDNPFISSETKTLKACIQKKEEKFDPLPQRMEPLKAIVTEPAYELNKKINAL